MCLSGTVAILLLEVLELSREFADLRCARNITNSVVTTCICTARIEGGWVEPRALLHALHALHHYTLQTKIILADFTSGSYSVDSRAAVVDCVGLFGGAGTEASV